MLKRHSNQHQFGFLELEIDEWLHIAGLYLANDVDDCREQHHIHKQVALREISHKAISPTVGHPMAHKAEGYEHKHPNIACDALHKHLWMEFCKHLREHIHHTLKICVSEHHESEQHKHKGKHHREKALDTSTVVVAVMMENVKAEHAVYHLSQAKEGTPKYEIPTRAMPQATE